MKKTEPKPKKHDAVVAPVLEGSSPEENLAAIEGAIEEADALGSQVTIPEGTYSVASYFEVSSALFAKHQTFFGGLGITFADRPGTTVVAGIGPLEVVGAIRDHSGYWVVNTLEEALVEFVDGTCSGCS